MTLAVIGGGPSGLLTAKSALETGLVPTVFEKESEVGGIWHPITGSVWEGMRTNLSHYSCMFSDFPWSPKPSNPFPKAREVFDYFQAYITTFGLNEYIHCNSLVVQAKQKEKKWEIRVSNGEHEEVKEFDYLVVASGIFARTYTPQLPGMEKFSGTISHVKEYKTPSGFEGKNVAIIGNAFSGTEIAAELSSVASKVTLVARQPYIVLPRNLPLGEKEVPLDLVFYSRKSAQASAQLLLNVQNKRKNGWLRGLSKQESLSEELQVKTPLEDPPRVVISDTFFTQYEQKKITLETGDVRKITESGITMSNGSSIDADSILFATGYQASLPFFDESMLEKLEFNAEDMLQPLLLHKATFPKDVSNVAFVGMYRGPYFGVMELQARWATRVFSRKVDGPSEKDLDEGIQRERAIRKAFPRPQFPHGDYVIFADSIAREIGVYPETFDEDEEGLKRKVEEGPFFPAHFRLEGPQSNRGAAISSINELD